MLISSVYKNVRRCVSTKAISRAIDLSSEVRSALEANKPVVALESTIITHGMPHPDNLETALSVESIIRDQGAIPATIGILNGRIKIGLEHRELEDLSKPTANAVKTSRRDFPYVLSHNLNGGTTVSGTLMIASHVGIKVFVTGGVGGVHRQGESTLDISADLVEMGRQPIMVVSSGIKSILDIERTLEYLETQGVCVMSYGPSKHFPAFYCEKSGFMAPYHVTQPVEAAKVLFQSNELGLGSGILLAVPIPKPFSIDREIMDTSINLALEEADSKGVQGKEITPFVLERVGQITAGKSLKSNIALIKNNAQVGGQVAVEYQKLAEARKRSLVLGGMNTKGGNGKVVVVGGAVLDCVMTLQSDLKADGRTLPGRISQTPGGVGRNIADSLGKLRCSSSSESTTSFITTLGNDQFGQFLMESLEHLDTSGVRIVDKGRTACYSALIDTKGDAKLGVGDMEIHSNISPTQIAANGNSLITSDFVVIDGNIPAETIESVLNISHNNRIPVWFEPTDVLKSQKPFNTNLWTTISCSSPNLFELKEMASAAGVRLDEELLLNNVDGLLKQLLYLGQPLVEHIPILMVTMGKLGMLMLSQCSSDESLRDALLRPRKPEIYARYYPAVPLPNVVNSLGAGDNTAAGFIDGLLRGLTEPECVALGHLASREALQSPMAVPKEFKSYKADSQTKAAYLEVALG